MTARATPSPPGTTHPRSRPDLPRLSALVALLSGGLSLALVGYQHHDQVLHPHYLPFAILIVTMMVATLVSLLASLWPLITGSSRVAALKWLALSLTPMVIWAGIGGYAKYQWRNRRVPNNLPMNLARMAAASLMRLEASLEYPRRVETTRLVMFYKDLDTPEIDAQAMDQHLARLETLLGAPLRAKVYWVRGGLPVLSLNGLSTNGLALGSDHSPSEWQLRGEMDRHELAHAARDQSRPANADPPCLLNEGWAQSQSLSRADLIRMAVGQRSGVPHLRVRDLLSPASYHYDFGPVYLYGGAFVDFLIGHYGMPKFLRFFDECRPDTFDATCREVFGKSFDALEADFWAEAQDAELRD
ncbi:MAG TPA: hypothetical protein VGZ22_16980 [Isosphaeraceae bacterium]|jgi:hypothetical protein|nr:hypothetical protein [Isosphaeraceae bacterium]